MERLETDADDVVDFSEVTDLRLVPPGWFDPVTGVMQPNTDWLDVLQHMTLIEDQEMDAQYHKLQ